MFRIGEFSRLTQVSVRMLRYYDEAGLLKPAEVDKFTGYRLYAARQIPDLNKIVFLRDLGFGVGEIAEALPQWSGAYVAQRLEEKRREIEAEIALRTDKLAKIELAQSDIQKEKIAVHTGVFVKAVPAYQVFSLRRVVPDYYAEGMLWEEMAAYAKDNNIPIESDTFTIYHDEDYRERDVDIEICAPVAHMGLDAGGFAYRCTEAVPLMACTMVRGPFENIAGAYLAFADWLGEHNQYKMGCTSRQIVHRGQWNEQNPADYLTEIQVPLEKK